MRSQKHKTKSSPCYLLQESMTMGKKKVEFQIKKIQSQRLERKYFPGSLVDVLPKSVTHVKKQLGAVK